MSDEKVCDCMAENSSKSYEVKAPHVTDGHTFVVTTVVTETVSQEFCDSKLLSTPSCPLTAVPINNERVKEAATKTTPVSMSMDADLELPCCSSQAVVPLSTSLPSKFLRFHAKRSAQTLLQQTPAQTQSVDSQFSSDEGAIGTTSSGSECDNELFDVLTPTAPPMSPPMSLSASPLTSSTDDKLIDVGMGSSIGDSEESQEEDDELKPLAVDNHMLLDVDLGLPLDLRQEQAAAVLSEANLRKHHHHSQKQQQQQQPQRQQEQLQPQLHHMDNIYLHPNFKYELDASPPPAVAPANSPVAETRRVHRSFLSMKKTIEDVQKAPTTETDEGDEQAELVNEIDSLDAALVPSEEVAAEITEAVEYYFSNESILKDAFLLKHVRRNKEGFVSLKLVSSFKRVRQLTKDWKVVGNAVRRKSQKIELNDVGTKVRRLEPLPNFDETMPSRTIVACDLPLDKLSIEKVSDIFSKCGEIALIRILKPGMAIPVDVRQFMNKYPEMQQKECALVEYLESSSAREAKNLTGAFQVFEMVAPKKKTGKKAVLQVAAPVTRMVENYGRYYNDTSYERTRGGSFSGITQQHDVDLRFKLKRNNSDYHTRALASDMQPQQGHHSHHHHYHVGSPHYNHYQPHSLLGNASPRGSYGGGEHHMHSFQHYQSRGSSGYEGGTPTVGSPSASNMNSYTYSPRRYSNTSTLSANTAATAAGLADATSAPPTTPVSSNHNNNNNNNSSSSNNNNTHSNTGFSNLQRRLSNCSESNYSNSLGETTRRPSNCSEHAPQRRDSNCSESCPCARRVSDYTQNEVYRKTSVCSNGSCGERRFSNGSMQFERTFSNASDNGSGNGNGFYGRRRSNDFNLECKPTLETQTSLPYEPDNLVGGGGGGYNVFPRRYSNNFQLSNKLASYDNAHYINGRRISTDSGYDRRCSFGSEYEGSPRSRTGSFLSGHKHGGDYDGQPRSRTGSFLDGSPRSRSGSFAQRAAESLVRTPMGPDGSKGFGTRARKFGQTVSPVN